MKFDATITPLRPNIFSLTSLPRSAWLPFLYPHSATRVVSLCFGSHSAFLEATLPAVELALDICGAAVSRMRPGGCEPSSNQLPESRHGSPVGCTAEPLIPDEDHEAIVEPLGKADPAGQRLRCVECAGADHGSKRDARISFNPQRLAKELCLLLGRALRFSPGGCLPLRRWAWAVRGWCERPCWWPALSPLSSPRASCGG